MKTKDTHRNISCLPITVLAFCVITIICSVVLYCNINIANDRISDLTEKYYNLEESISDNKQIIVTTDANLEFLKEQIKNHQEFIERERQFLLWMLIAIINIAVFVLAFFNFKTANDIKESIEKQFETKYGDMVVEYIAEAVDDDESLTYLKQAVKAEKNARNKRILFFNQEGTETFDSLVKSCKRFLPQDSVLSIPFVKSELNRLDERNDFDIIVYEVIENEFGTQDDPSLPYRQIDSHCEKSKQHCILYCTDIVNKKSLSEEFTTLVQLKLTLRDAIYSLLYPPPWEI